MPRALLVVIALVSLMHPTAQAQTPAADVTVEIPAGPVEIALGDSHEVPFTITFRMSGIVCSQAAEIRVPLRVEDRPSPLDGVRASTHPEAVFTIPAGSHGVGATPAFTQTHETGLSIQVDASAPPDHAHAFDVVAAFPGGRIPGCQTATDVPAVEGRGTHDILTGPARDAATASDAGSAPGAAATKESPPVTVLGVLLAVALAAMRRR